MNVSASVARIGVGPAEPMHAFTARSPAQRCSASEATAMTIALRVPIFENCCGASAGAMWNAAISSSSAIALRFGPVTNSATGTRRVPRTDATSTTASEANSGGSPSPAGDDGAEVPADRPAVADLRRPDGPARDREARQAVAELGDQPRVGHAGADAQPAVLGRPLGQLPDPRRGRGPAAGARGRS